jgi:hypothetical protein
MISNQPAEKALVRSSFVLGVVALLALPFLAVAAAVTLRYPIFEHEPVPISGLIACSIALIELIAFVVVSILVVRRVAAWSTWALGFLIVVLCCLPLVAVGAFFIANVGDPAP